MKKFGFTRPAGTRNAPQFTIPEERAFARDANLAIRKTKTTDHFNCMLAKKLAQNLSQEQAAFATLLANYNGYKCVLSPNATPTITQSGLLAVLLEWQRYKVIKLARRRARHEKMRAAFWRTLAWLFHARTVRTLPHDSTKPLIGTVPRHT